VFTVGSLLLAYCVATLAHASRAATLSAIGHLHAVQHPALGRIVSRSNTTRAAQKRQIPY
jgi:hypothetical protein